MRRISEDFRRVSINASWNLLGNALPLLVALAAVPFLLDRIGLARFGLLSLVWVLIGYFSLFDLGLGRALTKSVAQYVGESRQSELPQLCSTSVVLVGIVGLVGGVLLALMVLTIDVWKLWVPSDLLQESRNALFLISLGTPLTVLTAAYRGMLEGFQEFRVLNLVRIPSGAALFAAPCLTAAVTPRLDVAVGALIVARVFVLAAHAWPCRKLVQLKLAHFQQERVAPLVKFGGWLTVSNVIGPLIVYLDRFVVGALLSASAVAFYSAPFEIVSRLLIVPAALTAALFPALSSHAKGTHSHSKLQREALYFTLAIVVPIAIVGVWFSESLLHHWLGREFAERSTLPMQIMLLGFVLNAIAHIPFAVLHSHGRTRATALLHMVELPFYVVLVYFMVMQWGLEGAAIAWAARAGVDLVAMSWMARRN